jgi:hypothetical protein
VPGKVPDQPLDVMDDVRGHNAGNEIPAALVDLIGRAWSSSPGGDDCTTGCASVSVSLNQAIEIHARVLAHRFGDRAPLHAQEKAHHCSASGDDEGHAVWLRVAAVAEMLLKEKSRQQQSRHDA